MISSELQKAREYEARNGPSIPPEQRPVFHLSPQCGWMNDPNGFGIYRGQYHMFYQYYPYASHWDSMHWGHAVSGDMLHWEYLPCALAPDEAYDREGCFSGSAFPLPDGQQLLMYTGVSREQQENGQFQELQTQNLAVGDGTDYRKYEGNPVLTAKDLPEGGSNADFRDPKIFQLSDGRLCCAIGNRPADGSGQILLYLSDDGFCWKFWKVLAANGNRFGRMWECPDFFPLDGKWVLITSPQDMLPEGFEYHNGNGTLCLTGNFDEQTGDFEEETDQAIDYGIDFYAPQTVLMPDGRRVMIGWMQNWDACAIRMPEAAWAGQMSLPRELSLRNGRLYQQPLRELASLRRDEAEFHDIPVCGQIRLPGVSGRAVEMEIRVRPANPAALFHKFMVRFAENEQFHTAFSFRPHEGTLKADRKFSGSRRAIIHQRRCLVEHRDGVLTFRLILDRFSAECFIGDGEQVMSMSLYTEPSAEGISFYADGEALMDLKFWRLGD
ncbi:MAG: glycoside hydrolase family 32 protein [Stomatobaculum sp.]|nr:glycoside hydrolase family 32 protein [Stomatobaculum sp.]